MACGRQPGHGRTPQGGRRARAGRLPVVIGSSRAGTSGPKARIGSSRARTGRRQTRIGGLRTGTSRTKAGIGGSRARASRRQTRIGGLRTGTSGTKAGIGGSRARASRRQTGIGSLRARAGGSPGAGARRWLADAGRTRGRAGHGVMLPRWPAEPCRTSLPPVSTAGPVIPWLSDPVRGRANAGRRGISGWLRRRSRYHGSLRTGRDGDRPVRGIMAKLLAREPGPVPPARLAPPHTAGCPTPGPRSRPMLTRCRGVRLNEAGRPAALIMAGLPCWDYSPVSCYSCSVRRRTMRPPLAWPPSQHVTPVNDGTATSMRNFTECSVGVLACLSSCDFAGIG
jgi:hypothetical protein